MQANPQDSSMQADEVQNAKKPIAAQVDLSGQTLCEQHHKGMVMWHKKTESS